MRSPRCQHSLSPAAGYIRELSDNERRITLPSANHSDPYLIACTGRIFHLIKSLNRLLLLRPHKSNLLERYGAHIFYSLPILPWKCTR